MSSTRCFSPSAPRRACDPWLGPLIALACACAADASAPVTTTGSKTDAGTASAQDGATSFPPSRDGGGSTPIVGGCGGDRYDAQSRQLDMYMMVDESGSMVPWWPFVLQALNGFITSPSAAGIGVGLQLFGESCNVADYATPKVPIAPLPGNAQALSGAFPILPTSGTATRPALEGAISHARAWAESHPDSKTVVLLVTDGLPDECASTVTNVADVARAGFSGSPSIPTYVIGLPLLEPLNPIAVAGGTERAYAADPTNAQALIDTLNAVRGVALPCDYALPANTADRGLVNLDYRGSDGSVTRIPQVTGAAACPASGQGWYYDGGTPGRIVACDATCSTFKSGGGQVDVVLGCPTEVLL
jgi:hypothetical protein